MPHVKAVVAIRIAADHGVTLQGSLLKNPCLSVADSLVASLRMLTAP